MILVTGATGHLGHAVVQQLLTKTSANNIAVLARDANKATDYAAKGISVRIGDFNDIASLAEATKGIEKVLLISGLDPVNRYQQHKNVVDAAQKNGVKRIGYTGVSMESLATSDNQFLMQSHFQTEDYIKESGLAYTFYRNSLYTDTILFFAGEKAMETGIFLPTGSGKVSFALRREIGEAIANDLLATYTENRIYEITGAEASSYEEVAHILTQLSGKQVAFVDANETAYMEQLKQYQVPDEYIQVLSCFSKDIKNNQHSRVTDDLKKLLGREPLNLRSSLKELYSL